MIKCLLRLDDLVIMSYVVNKWMISSRSFMALDIFKLQLTDIGRYTIKEKNLT